MHGSRRFCLDLALMCSAFLISGCSTLGAVRGFAASSARTTDYRAAADHYLESADRQLAELPDAKRFDDARKQLQPAEAGQSLEQAIQNAKERIGRERAVRKGIGVVAVLVGLTAALASGNAKLVLKVKIELAALA